LGAGYVRNVEALNLQTGGGNDRITNHETSAMSDTIVTGNGNDSVTIHMGGADAVHGGGGTDTLAVTYAIATNGVWLMDAVADGSGGYSGTFNGLSANDLVFTGIERFLFTDLSGGNDIIRAGDFNDTLSGGGGNDELVGHGGNDKLSGGDGNDALYGESGQDRLSGNGGDDMLSGGADADIFIFGPGHGNARVIDFEDGLDRIDLRSFGFDTVTEAKSYAADVAGDVVFTFVSGAVLTIENMTRAQLAAADLIL
jgi:Ca2+-binding RTX toxin-like protein